MTLQEKIGKGEFGDVRLGQYRWVEHSLVIGLFVKCYPIIGGRKWL